jgi:hypothetical protein
MKLTYRCMKCGQNEPAELGVFPECSMCKEETIMVVVTDKNKDSLPFPTNPRGRAEIDFNDPSKNCQCRAGTCPCGKFVAHAVKDPCNSYEFMKND